MPGVGAILSFKVTLPAAREDDPGAGSERAEQIGRSHDAKSP